MKRLKLYLIPIMLAILTLSQFLYAQLSQEMQIERKNAVVLIKAYKTNDVVDIGAGIIVGHDDPVVYVITAFHVVKEEKDKKDDDIKIAREVYIEFYNKPTSIRKATIYRKDPDKDLAVLHIDGADLINYIKPLPIADPSKLPAETYPVFAIGHPGNLQWSVTQGLVISTPDASKIGFSGDAIQPGNSGGPLLNTNGELIGMVITRGSLEGKGLRADLARDQVERWRIPTNNLMVGGSDRTYSGEPVASIEVLPASANVSVGATVQLTGTLRDTKGNVLYGRDITWASNNRSIATVSSTGDVTGLKIGNVTITATCEGRTEAAIIKVIEPEPAAIEIHPAELTVEKRDKIQLSAMLTDSRGQYINEKRTIKWSSSDKSIAIVAKEGVVEAREVGIATITARWEGITATVPISVEPAAVAFIDIDIHGKSLFDTKKWEIYPGSTFRLKAELKDRRKKKIKGQRTINWSSDDNSIASVSPDGTVTGYAFGTTIITAECEGISASRSIRVSGGPIKVTAALDDYRIPTQNGNSIEPRTVFVEARSAGGSPVTEANVVIESYNSSLKFRKSGGSRVTGYTDSRGNFRAVFDIFSWPAGSIYMVARVSKPNYETRSADVAVHVDETPLLNQNLNPMNQNLNPIHLEAEQYDQASAHVGIDGCSEGGRLLGWINDGEWVRFDNVDFGSGGLNTFKARVASAENGGRITIHLDNPNGEVIGSCQVPGTGSWQNWRTISCGLTSKVVGRRSVYLVCSGTGTYLFNINWIEFSP